MFFLLTLLQVPQRACDPWAAEQRSERPRSSLAGHGGSVFTHGDDITHLRRAISELVFPATVLSGTHWRQRLARFINWFNDALPLFQKNFCLLLHCATTQNARGNQPGFPWNRAVCSDSVSFWTLPHLQLVQPVALKKKKSRNLSIFSISLQILVKITLQKKSIT